MTEPKWQESGFFCVVHKFPIMETPDGLRAKCPRWRQCGSISRIDTDARARYIVPAAEARKAGIQKKELAKS